MTRSEPKTYVSVRAHQRDTPYYEGKWRSAVTGQQVKRRLGPAWVTQDTSGAWVKRRGRTPEDHLDPRTAPLRAVEVMRVVEAELREQRRLEELAAGGDLTFRAVAQAWLKDIAREAKPATVRDYAALLREPGQPHKRGNGTSPGHILRAFGDRDVREVTPKDVAGFLRGLDDLGFKPRNVNKYRQTIGCVFAYACRPDTYGIDNNPVEVVRKRKEPPPAALDYYEPHEVEQLAQALADGKHRTDRGDNISVDERLCRAADDQRDAELIRLLLYTGLRMGEVRALRWSDIDLTYRTLYVRRGISAGEEVLTPKGGRTRFVPLSDQALAVLERLRSRPDYIEPDDLVFPGRDGRQLDDAALRRRYHAAREAIGLRKVKLHGLRHAAGSILARNASAVEVRDFLGHANLSTTDRYVSARWSPEFMRRMGSAFQVDPGAGQAELEAKRAR